MGWPTTDPPPVEGEEEPPREEPWFNFTLPWEETTRGWGYRRARRRWRQRHQRIFRLEQSLGYIDDEWQEYRVFPWVYLHYESW